jgi:deoxycytidine triphosphate deaminase
MILSTAAVFRYIDEGKIRIEPFDSDSLKEASYTLKLAEAVDLLPHGFALGTSLEKITLSSSVAGLISTRSAIARMGVDVAQSSFFCSPETDNQITFEIVNHTDKSMRIEKNESVAKIIFTQLL